MKISLKNGFIRPWKPQDLPVLLRCFAQERLRKNLRSSGTYPLQNITNPTHFAVEIQGEAVAGLGFDLDQKHHQANLGFWIDEKFAQKGIISEAIPKLCTWFQPLHLDYVIQATVYGWNPVSQHVLEKSGFYQVAKLPGAIRYSDEVTDLLIYEWDSLSQAQASASI